MWGKMLDVLSHRVAPVYVIIHKFAHRRRKILCYKYHRELSLLNEVKQRWKYKTSFYANIHFLNAILL